MLYEKELDAVLHEIVARWDIPGMAVGIVEGDQITYRGEFGVQNLQTQKPVTFDSIFCVASVSKCFTATAVMQLAERGKIELDVPLVQYLPWFELDDQRYRQMTIRQMLSHTSGMPDLTEMEYDVLMQHPEWDDAASERWIRNLKPRHLVSNPGEQFHYSNIAYNVLGMLIANVSGKSFEKYMQEEVLAPSGMTDSTFLLADVQPGRLAVPHLRSPEMIVNPIYPYHRADAPSSFLHATAADMCHWGITSLNRGKYDWQSILSPAGYDLMWSKVIGRGSSRGGFYEAMGLGWTLGHHRGVKVVSHGGMGFGWTDFLLILPEKNRAAVILCNEESYARSRTIDAVADVLLDIQPQPGTISWMIPISHALQTGGIQAAYTCYKEIMNSKENSFAEDDLINLAIQLTSLKKFDLAIEVLELNLHAFPEHIGTYSELARLFQHNSDRAKAEKCLMKALSIDPDNSELQDLWGQIKTISEL